MYVKHLWPFPKFLRLILLHFSFRWTSPTRILLLYIPLSFQCHLQIPKERCCCHHISTKTENLRRYGIFHGMTITYCRVNDISLCTEGMAEITVFGMGEYILHTFSDLEPRNPWLNSACFHANQNREAHKRYRL